MSKNNIPKKIHFCWFGGNEFNDLVQKCIDSWKQYLPEYEFKLWNEENFDINSVEYVKQAYESKKWAFVSDYVRLWALYNDGGIYLDTDVEVIKSLDELLDNEIFVGFESKYTIGTAIIGAKKNNEFIREFLEFYKNRSFYRDDGDMDLIANTKIITDMLVRQGIKFNNKAQIISKDIKIYPKECFSPKSIITNDLHITDKTYCIHHFDGSWIDNKQKKTLKDKIRSLVIKIIGEDQYSYYIKLRQKRK